MATTPDIELSPAQNRAVDSESPALVITARAGSGKTEVVARRIERLLAADPGGASRILAVSYTVKAAEEMRDRLRSRIGQSDRRVDCETVHRFAHSLLRRSGSWVGLPVEPQVIAEDDDRVELMRSWLDAQGEDFESAELLDILRVIDLARARRAEAPYLSTWREALADRGAVDYPAMIDKAIELAHLPATNRQLRRLYGHIIVDEAQNLTPAQYALLTALCGPPPVPQPSMALVGDPNQSIVSFAGADAHLIEQFAAEYAAEEIPLDENFRCARRIQVVADAVAAGLGRSPRSEANPAAEGLVDVCEFADEVAEGDAIASWVQDLLDRGLPEESLAAGESPTVRPEEIAILGRSASALRYSKESLDERGVPSAIAIRPEDWVTSPHANALVHLMSWLVGDDFVPRRGLARLLEESDEALPDIDSALAVMRTLGGTWASLADVVQRRTPQEVIDGLGGIEIGDDDDARAEWDQDLQQISDAWKEYCQLTDLQDRSWGGFRVHVTRVQRVTDVSAGVRLMTVHKSQGREFRAVAVVGLNEGQLPDFRNTADPDDLRAELRTFYVAVSRPSRVLLLSRARQRMTRRGPWATDRSQFLELVKDQG